MEFEILTFVQVFGAITFYFENQTAVDACRMRQTQRFQAARRAAALLPDHLASIWKRRVNISFPGTRSEAAPSGG